MGMSKLKKLTFAAFISVIVFGIVVAVMAKVIGRSPVGADSSLFVLKIFVWINTFLNLGLIVALVLNFVKLRVETSVKNERKFVLISLVAFIANIVLKSSTGFFIKVMLGRSPLIDQFFPIFHGIGKLIIAVAFLVSIVFYILAWFLYGQDREENQ